MEASVYRINSFSKFGGDELEVTITEPSICQRNFDTGCPRQILHLSLEDY